MNDEEYIAHLKTMMEWQQRRAKAITDCLWPAQPADYGTPANPSFSQRYGYDVEPEPEPGAPMGRLLPFRRKG